jgi:hypothetical protein
LSKRKKMEQEELIGKFAHHRRRFWEQIPTRTLIISTPKTLIRIIHL